MCAKNLAPPPPGFDPRTVQPVASRYTDYAIPYSFVRACFPSAGYKTTISSRSVLKPAGVATSWQIVVDLDYCRLPGLSHNRFGGAFKGRTSSGRQSCPRGWWMILIGILAL